MKKELNILLLCVLLLINLCSCLSFSDSPEEVAEKYITASFNFDFDAIDEVCIVPNEELFYPQIAYLLEEYGYSEEEAYERVREVLEVDTPIKNYKDYTKAYGKKMREELIKQYGKDYKLDIVILNTSPLSDEDKTEMLTEAADHYYNSNINLDEIADFSNIGECQQVEAKIYITGSKLEKHDAEDSKLYLAKTKKGWKVLNFGSAN